MEAIAKSLGILAATLLLAIPLALWQAYVIVQLWGWFVTPAFAVAAPGLWTVAGLVMLARMPFERYRNVDNGLGGLVGGVLFAIIYPAAALGLGALYHAFGWVA